MRQYIGFLNSMCTQETLAIKAYLVFYNCKSFSKIEWKVIFVKNAKFIICYLLFKLR